MKDPVYEHVAARYRITQRNNRGCFLMGVIIFILHAAGIWTENTTWTTPGELLAAAIAAGLIIHTSLRGLPVRILGFYTDDENIRRYIAKHPELGTKPSDAK